jgi:hypothetical protein
VWRHGRVGCQTFEGIGKRERQAEEAFGGADAGWRGDERVAVAKVVGPADKRKAVTHLTGSVGLSERRACCLVGADRSMIRYLSRRPPDTERRQRLRDLANERRQFGYRRLFILLRREGELSGINRI